MNKTAIDVVLLLSPSMTAKAIEINAELLKTFDDKIILDAEHCLPHISLCMGVVSNEDLPEIMKILSDVVRETSIFELTANEISVGTTPTGEKVSGLTINRTEDLQKLHESIIQNLRSLLSYEVDVSMLYNPPEIEEVTFTWIKGYDIIYNNPASFHPHMTVGLGETDKFAFPIHFTAGTIALCQLGNYCTCRKVLASFNLKPAAIT
jgi:2'-5' RNA ligase